MEVVRALQGAPSWVTDVAEVVTFLGDSEFYLLAFPLLYWSISRRLGLQLGVILLLSASLNAVLKLGFATPRPSFLEPEVGLIQESSYGIPSGHSQNAVALWGLLATELRSRWWQLACGMVILALGWSRLQLGVHFPIDTVAGFAVGAVVLVLFVRWRDPVASWFDQHPPLGRVGIALVASLALIGLAVAVRAAWGTTSIPNDWIGTDPADPPFSLDAVVVASSALFGIISGTVLLATRGGFETDGAWWRRVLRYPVGLVGVIVLLLGLGEDPTGDSLPALVILFVQYSLIGLWIGGLAPLLFVALRLAPARTADPSDESSTP